MMHSVPNVARIIERDGHVGIRARDGENPARSHFRGIRNFPVSPDWAVDARFEPYPPGRKIPIVNVLGMQEDMDCPGAVVFRKDGKEWRLDAVLESRIRKHQRLETPDLDISYEPPATAGFMRGIDNTQPA